jgi:hypothetical protein
VVRRRVALAEIDREQVPTPAREQEERELGAALDARAQRLGQALVETRLVGRKLVDVVEALLAEAFAQLAVERARPHEARVGRERDRRVPAAHEHAMGQALGRIGGRKEEHRAGAADAIQPCGERGRSAYAAGGEAHAVTAPRGEVEDAVHARIHARQQRAPVGQGGRRHHAPQRRVHAAVHQREELRQPHSSERAHHVEVRAVEADQQGLRAPFDLGALRATAFRGFSSCR